MLATITSSERISLKSGSVSNAFLTNTIRINVQKPLSVAFALDIIVINLALINQLPNVPTATGLTEQ